MTLTAVFEIYHPQTNSCTVQHDTKVTTVSCKKRGMHRSFCYIFSLLFVLFLLFCQTTCVPEQMVSSHTQN